MGEESGSTTPPSNCALEGLALVFLDGPTGESLSSEEGRMTRLLAMPSLLTGNCVSPTGVLMDLGTEGGAKGDETIMSFFADVGMGGGGISGLVFTLLQGVLGNKGRTGREGETCQLAASASSSSSSHERSIGSIWLKPAAAAVRGDNLFPVGLEEAVIPVLTC